MSTSSQDEDTDSNLIQSRPKKSSVSGEDTTSRDTEGGSTMLQETSNSSQTILPKSCDAIRTWPFASPYLLRSVYNRMQHNATVVLTADSPQANVLSDDFAILSSLSFDEKLSYLLDKSYGDSSSNVSSIPIMEYLQTDILQIIFSFLGYKRLVKLREVCSTWKEITDTSKWLWFTAYKSRFGLLPEDCKTFDAHGSHITSTGSHCGASAVSSVLLAARPAYDWKELFQSKWRAERNLQFRWEYGSGWRYRICQHIGCLVVMTSAKKQAQHYKSHQRREQREQAQMERSQQREKVRNKKRKLKEEAKQKQKKARAGVKAKALSQQIPSKDGKTATRKASPSRKEIWELEVLLSEWDEEDQHQKELKELENQLVKWNEEEQLQQAEVEAWLEQQDINDLAVFLKGQFGDDD